MPITVVLDNVRYQKCARLQELAQRLGIELLYLPAYSPNLNLIERLWKWVKKNCLYSKYYATSEDFQKAIQECIPQAHGKHQASCSFCSTLLSSIPISLQIQRAPRYTCTLGRITAIPNSLM